jgi:hypothetical protein
LKIELPYTIEEGAKAEKVTSQHTARKTVENGVRSWYLIETKFIPSASILSIINWDSGFMEIKADITDKGNTYLNRLERGLRIGIERYPFNAEYLQIRVRQARVKPDSNNWSNVYKCNTHDLDSAAGFEASAFLASKCIHFDNRHHLPHPQLYKSNDLFAIFKRSDIVLPVHIYTISRILPILNKKMSDDQLRLF